MDQSAVFKDRNDYSTLSPKCSHFSKCFFFDYINYIIRVPIKILQYNFHLMTFLIHLSNLHII